MKKIYLLMSILLLSACSQTLTHSEEATTEIINQLNEREETSPSSVNKESIKIYSSLAMSDKLKDVYDQFAITKEEEYLRGLQPFEVFQLYYYAGELEDFETQYAFYLKGEKYVVPTFEQFLKDIDHEITRVNSREFLVELKEVEQFHEKIVEGTAGISFIFPTEEYGMSFGLHNDDGIWKVRWLPLQ